MGGVFRETSDPPQPDKAPKAPSAGEGKPKKSRLRKFTASTKDGSSKGSSFIKIDIADFLKLKGEKAEVFKLYFALQYFAFKKGNPFRVSYKVIQQDTAIDQHHIKRLSERLAVLRMLEVERGKSTRTMNKYILLSGCYTNHQRTKKTTVKEPAKEGGRRMMFTVRIHSNFYCYFLQCNFYSKKPQRL